MASPPSPEREPARYAVFSELATGTTGTVHVGSLVGANGFTRAVAIKRLHARYAGDARFVATLLDEAGAAIRVRHPNVVSTLDVVTTPEQVLLVTEYVSGESLRRLLDGTSGQGERVAPQVVSAVVAGALHGLHAAHEAKNDFGEPLGIVHGDVSPEHVLVGTDGVARVLGFGMGKPSSGTPPARNAAQGGKVGYMAPEQLRGAPATRKTDVFAASVVLWEALTRRSLFTGESDKEVKDRILAGQVPLPSSFDPRLPAEIDAVVKRGLEREPSRRWPTAREMALALERALAPAVPSEIAAWVESTAGEGLARRARRIAEVAETAGSNLRAGAFIPTREFIADALWSKIPPRAGVVERPSASASAPAEQSIRAPRIVDAGEPRDAPAIELAEVPAPVARAEPPRPSAWYARIARQSAALAMVSLVALGGVLLLVPHYVRRQATATAAAQGLTLRMDDVSVGFGGIGIAGVTLTSADLPGMKATAAEMHVELSWLEPKLVTVRGAEIALDGPVKDVVQAADRMRAAHGDAALGRAGGDWLRVAVPLVRVTWTHAFGDARLDIPEGSLDIAPRVSPRLGDEYHFTTQKLALVTSAATLGPWRLDLDRETNGSRARVAFDPPVPDGPNALLVRSTSGETSIDVTIPRSPLARLGAPPAVTTLLPVQPRQFEAMVHYATVAGDRIDASLAVTLYGVKMPPAPAPLDVRVAGAVTGDPRSALDLKDGTLSAGPVKATLSGPVTIDNGGLHAALVWKGAPIPCAQLVPAQTKQAAGDLMKQLGSALGAMGGDMGDVTQQLSGMGLDVGSLVQGSGVAQVSGTLSVSGTLTIETSDVTKSGFTTKVKNSCGLSLFGGL